jgi:hypothetical protein
MIALIKPRKLKLLRIDKPEDKNVKVGNNGNVGLRQLREQRDKTIERWKKLGLLDGLKGNVKEDCAKLFGGQLSYPL